MSFAPQKISVEAGETVKRRGQGNYVVVFEHSDDFEINIDSRGWLPISRRCGLPIEYSESVEVKSETAQEITLFMGDTNGLNPYDTLANTLVIGEVQRIVNTVDTRETPKSTLAGLADVTATANSAGIIAPANLDRREISITMPIDMVDGIRISGSNVSATRGTRYLAGQTAIIDNTAAIHYYNENATDQILTINEAE